MSKFVLTKCVMRYCSYLASDGITYENLQHRILRGLDAGKIFLVYFVRQRELPELDEYDEKQAETVQSVDDLCLGEIVDKVDRAHILYLASLLCCPEKDQLPVRRELVSETAGEAELQMSSVVMGERSSATHTYIFRLLPEVVEELDEDEEDDTDPEEEEEGEEEEDVETEEEEVAGAASEEKAPSHQDRHRRHRRRGRRHR